MQTDRQTDGNDEIKIAFAILRTCIKSCKPLFLLIGNGKSWTGITFIQWTRFRTCILFYDMVMESEPGTRACTSNAI
jgi:hypothetical protein